MSQETSEISNDVDDLDEALAGYQSAIEIEPEPIPEVEEESNPVQETPSETTSPIGTTEGDWRGNPLYYQTGKKAGTLRKSLRHKSPPEKEMEISGTLISGAMFILLVDMLIPMLLTFANNSLSKKVINVEDIQMSSQQKKDLEPIGNEVVKYLTLRANPIWLMLIATTGIYGINLLAARAKTKSK